MKACFRQFFFQVVIGTPADHTHVDRILNEYWQIFVDNRFVPKGAINSDANDQPKAVFSCAMTVMDKSAAGDKNKNG